MQSSPADISVIIPAYQASRTIKRALGSIAAQTIKPREVIVVDDGSDDGTSDVARSAAATMGLVDIELVVIRQANGGAGAARNRAIAHSTGRYLAFLDADDEWLPEKLERSLPYFEDPEIVLVAHNNLHFEAGVESVNDSQRRFAEARNPFVGLYRKGFIGTCTVLAKRDAVVAAGGLDPQLRTAQDFDLWLTILAEPTTKFVVFGDALSRYHVTEGSITSHTYRRLRCGQFIAERHAPALSRYPGSSTFSLAYRLLAIFNEARMAYVVQGQAWRAIGIMALMPFSLIKSIIAVAFGPDRRRRNFLQDIC